MLCMFGKTDKVAIIECATMKFNIGFETARNRVIKRQKRLARLVRFLIVFSFLIQFKIYLLFICYVDMFTYNTMNTNQFKTEH